MPEADRGLQLGKLLFGHDRAGAESRSLSGVQGGEAFGRVSDTLGEATYDIHLNDKAY